MKTRIAVVAGAAALIAAALLLWSPAATFDAGDTQRDATPPSPATATASAPRRALAAAATAGGWYGAPVGRQLDYRLAVRQETTVRGAEGQAVPGGEGLRAAGALRLLIVARDDDGVVGRVCLPELSLGTTVADPAEDAAWAGACPALGRGFLVRWSDEGALLGWRARELDARGRLFARALLDALAFPVPASGGSEWTGTGRDGTGEYDATFQFRVAPPTLVRRKTSYQGIAGELTCNPAGEARAEFDAEIGWWTRVAVDERLALNVSEASARIEGRLTVDLALTEARDTGTGEDLGDGAFAPVDSSADATALAGVKIEQMQRARLAGRTVRDFVDDLERALAAAPIDGQRLHELTDGLAWLVRLRAEAAGELLALVRGGALGDDALVAVAGALGHAGTTDAQAALAALVGDLAADPRLREAAAIGAGRVARADGTLLQALARGLEGVATMDGPSSASLLALGALASQPGAVLADGRGALAVLLAYENKCRSLGATTVWLEALGNAGASAALDAAARLHVDADEQVRAAAATAVRKLEDPRATQLLSDIGRDASPLVHARAMRTLGQSPAAGATDLLADLWRNEPEPTRRRVVLDALGRRAPKDAAARATLTQAAAADANLELRAHAQRLLAR